MTYEDAQGVELGQRVEVRCPPGLGSAGVHSRGEVVHLTRFVPPGGTREQVGRISVRCDSDNKVHDLLPSLVHRLSLLELIAEAASEP